MRELERVVATQEAELEKLKFNITVHNDQVAMSAVSGHAGKKKKTWWGGTKKSKSQTPPPALVIDAAGSVFQNDEMGVSHQVDASGSAVMVRASHLQELSRKYQAQTKQLQERISELERQNAKIEAERAMLERDRHELHGKITRAESAVEASKARQQTLYNNAHESISKMCAVPLNGELPTETNQLRALLQLQEAALRKEALSREDLEIQLQSITMRHPPPVPYDRSYTGNNGGVSVEEFDALDRENNKLKKALGDLRDNVKECKLREQYFLNELGHMQKALKDATCLITHKYQKMNKRDRDTAHLLTATIQENERLQEQVAEVMAQARVDQKQLIGEVRGLRQGRVARFEGDEPTESVYPSPAPRTGRLPLRRSDLPHHEEREDSTKDSGSSDGHHDVGPASARSPEFYYEWHGGQYVLREGKPTSAPNEPSYSEPSVRDPVLHVNAMRQTILGAPAVTDQDRIVAATALRTWNEVQKFPRAQSASPTMALGSRQSDRSRRPPHSSETPYQQYLDRSQGLKSYRDTTNKHLFDSAASPRVSSHSIPAPSSRPAMAYTPYEHPGYPSPREPSGPNKRDDQIGTSWNHAAHGGRRPHENEFAESYDDKNFGSSRAPPSDQRGRPFNPSDQYGLGTRPHGDNQYGESKQQQTMNHNTASPGVDIFRELIAKQESLSRMKLEIQHESESSSEEAQNDTPHDTPKATPKAPRLDQSGAPSPKRDDWQFDRPGGRESQGLSDPFQGQALLPATAPIPEAAYDPTPAIPITVKSPSKSGVSPISSVSPIRGWEEAVREEASNPSGVAQRENLQSVIDADLNREDGFGPASPGRVGDLAKAFSGSPRGGGSPEAGGSAQKRSRSPKISDAHRQPSPRDKIGVGSTLR